MILLLSKLILVKEVKLKQMTQDKLNVMIRQVRGVAWLGLGGREGGGGGDGWWNARENTGAEALPVWRDSRSHGLMRASPTRWRPSSIFTRI